MSLRTLSALAALACLPLLTGCLDRDETITVAPDGGVEVLHVIRGDAGDFGPTGDALPTGPAWIVLDRDVPKRDGQGTEHVREARGRFASAAEVPTTFGAPDDPAPLHFTTALSLERLPDGATRYTFERRFEPRAWAWREHLLERHLPKALRDELGKGEPDAALKRKALAGVLAFERAKLEQLLEDALAAAHDGPVPVPTRLKARADFAAAYDAAWRVDDLMAFLDADAGRQASLEARYRDDTRRAAVSAATSALVELERGELAAVTARVGAAFERARRTLEASEDLQDEAFTLRVRLPAPVVTSDGAELEDGGRTAVFHFRGADLTDGALVLRAVAVARP